MTSSVNKLGTCFVHIVMPLYNIYVMTFATVYVYIFLFIILLFYGTFLTVHAMQCLAEG
jgi:hypothetical protein